MPQSVGGEGFGRLPPLCPSMCVFSQPSKVLECGGRKLQEYTNQGFAFMSFSSPLSCSMSVWNFLLSHSLLCYPLASVVSQHLPLLYQIIPIFGFQATVSIQTCWRLDSVLACWWAHYLIQCPPFGRYDWLANKNLRAGYFLWAMFAYGLGIKIENSNLSLTSFMCSFCFRVD